MKATRLLSKDSNNFYYNAMGERFLATTEIQTPVYAIISDEVMDTSTMEEVEINQPLVRFDWEVQLIYKAFSTKEELIQEIDKLKEELKRVV